MTTKPPTRREALLTLLDACDYTRGNWGMTEMVGACIPKEVLNLCHQALESGPMTRELVTQIETLAKPRPWPIFS
jgi:hypothetical protein